MNGNSGEAKDVRAVKSVVDEDVEEEEAEVEEEEG
jgi:hypothetical protein